MNYNHGAGCTGHRTIRTGEAKNKGIVLFIVRTLLMVVWKISQVRDSICNNSEKHLSLASLRDQGLLGTEWVLLPKCISLIPSVMVSGCGAFWMESGLD